MEDRRHSRSRQALKMSQLVFGFCAPRTCKTKQELEPLADSCPLHVTGRGLKLTAFPGVLLPATPIVGGGGFFLVCISIAVCDLPGQKGDSVAERSQDDRRKHSFGFILFIQCTCYLHSLGEFAFGTFFTAHFQRTTLKYIFVYKDLHRQKQY